MIIDKCMCRLRAGVIEVLAPPEFTIITKRKIAEVMFERVVANPHFKIPHSMSIKSL